MSHLGRLQIAGVRWNKENPKQTEREAPTVVSRHVDETRDEEAGVPLSKFNLNYVFQPKDPRDRKFKSVLRTEALPSSADLRPTWGSIFDQGTLGSCVSNSTAYCVRFVRQKDGLSVYDPSRLFIYYHGRLLEGFPIKEDTGLYIRSGYKSIAHHSVCSEKNWPYVESRFTWKPSQYAVNAAKQHKKWEYFSIPDGDLQGLKACLAEGYPISFGFTVFESFMTAETARTGVVPSPNVNTEDMYGGHAMTIVGYDDAKNHFVVANSWGHLWGDGGFCYFPYDYMKNTYHVGDFWTARHFG